MKQKILEVNITSNGGVLAPESLPTVLQKVEKKCEEVGWDHLFIISGRMPLWAAAAITHTLHPSKGVALFEPRSNAGIIVSRHSADVPIEGTMVPIDGEKIILEV